MSQPIEFRLDGSEYIELKNLLKVTGLFDTGGAAKNAIEQGEVHVDGSPETRKALKIRSGQIVTVKNQQVKVL